MKIIDKKEALSNFTLSNAKQIIKLRKFINKCIKHQSKTGNGRIWVTFVNSIDTSIQKLIVEELTVAGYTNIYWYEPKEYEDDYDYMTGNILRFDIQ